MAQYGAYALADPATEVGFVPHKALYEIKMKSKKNSAKVANIHGKMVYEWKPSCEAWVSSHNFDMTYEYFETPPVRITSDFSNYESFDGKEFNFTSTRKSGDLMLDEIRGNAQINSEKNSGGEVHYNKPEKTNFPLPQETLFPMAHTLDVLKKIKSGKKFHKATIFDGSDTDGPVDVNSIIIGSSAYERPKEYADQINEDLIRSEAWNIRLAFFPLMKYEVTSDYEMSLVFHENGVISDMIIEYDDFSISQKLMALERLEGTCDDSPEQKEKK